MTLYTITDAGEVIPVDIGEVIAYGTDRGEMKGIAVKLIYSQLKGEKS